MWPSVQTVESTTGGWGGGGGLSCKPRPGEQRKTRPGANTAMPVRTAPQLQPPVHRSKHSGGFPECLLRGPIRGAAGPHLWFGVLGPPFFHAPFSPSNAQASDSLSPAQTCLLLSDLPLPPECDPNSSSDLASACPWSASLVTTSFVLLFLINSIFLVTNRREDTVFCV